MVEVPLGVFQVQPRRDKEILPVEALDLRI